MCFLFLGFRTGFKRFKPLVGGLVNLLWEAGQENGWGKTHNNKKRKGIESTKNYLIMVRKQNINIHKQGTHTDICIYIYLKWKMWKGMKGHDKREKIWRKNKYDRILKVELHRGQRILGKSCRPKKTSYNRAVLLLGTRD
jgi:hypothetical protein